MKPQKHAELIKAWADGAEIEAKFGNSWEFRPYPSWTPNIEYRIKPPADRVYFACYDAIGEYSFTALEFRLYAVKQNLVPDESGEIVSTGQLKLTFDGSTGKIKFVEVL